MVVQQYPINDTNDCAVQYIGTRCMLVHVYLNLTRNFNLNFLCSSLTRTIAARQANGWEL